MEVTTWWKRTFEGLRGARCFTSFHLVLLISLAVFVGGVLVCVWVLVAFCFLVCVAHGEISSILRFIPVVDRPCLALVRQCRKKKISFSPGNAGEKKTLSRQQQLGRQEIPQPQKFCQNHKLQNLGAKFLRPLKANSQRKKCRN